jgi:hypothetical protein
MMNRVLRAGATFRQHQHDGDGQQQQRESNPLMAPLQHSQRCRRKSPTSTRVQQITTLDYGNNEQQR